MKEELADIKEEENEEDQGFPMSSTNVCCCKCCSPIRPKAADNQKYHEMLLR